MRKIFTFLLALLLSVGSMWGQTSTTTTWTWDELAITPYAAISGTNTVLYKYAWARGGENYPAFWLYILFNKSEMVTYDGEKYPPKGTYTISNNLSTPNVIANANVANKESSGTYCRTEYDASSSKYYYPITGSATVDEGDGLPYISYSATTNKNSSGNTVTSGSYQKIYVKIGSAATYYTVNVNTNNGTMGTATYAYKSGYVYANNRTTEFKKNSVYTLTATPKSGYRFVQWSDGNTNATRDVTITGNATYTATFAPLASTKYLITTAANNPAYGSVTPATGEQYENSNITLTATPNSGHKFIKWQKDGVDFGNTNPLTITVTKAETYTAVFEPFAAGTITAVANDGAMGTVTGGGNYAGNTNVTLTATPKSGYMFVEWNDHNTDNPRTIVVDGDASYTATFAVEVPLCSSVQYGTANHEIIWERHGDPNWANNYQTWWDEPDEFVRLRATNYDDNEMNHIQLCFWVDDFSTLYNGKIGPKEGTYTVAEPYVAGTGSNNNYWYLNKATYLNKAVVGYTEAKGFDDSYWNTSQNRLWAKAHSPYCAYIANKGCDYCSTRSFLGVPIGSTVEVSRGENDNCCVRVKNANGRLLFMIGTPIVPTPGTITVNADGYGQVRMNDGEWSSTISNSFEAGQALTIQAKADEGYVFTQWNDGNTDNPRTITVNGDKTYTAEFAPVAETIIIPGYSTFYDATSDESWYELIGQNDRFYVDICINSTTIDGVFNTDGAFDFDYTYIINLESEERINMTKASAIVEKSGNEYILNAVLYGSGKYYQVRMVFDANLWSLDTDGYHFENTYPLTAAVKEKDAQGNYPNELWLDIWDYRYQYYDEDLKKQVTNKEDLQLMFVVGSDKTYIPTGVYDIDDTQTLGTVRALNPGTNGGSYIYRDMQYSGGSGNFYWALRHGQVNVINPNHEDVPMYTEIDAQNSYGYYIYVEIGEEPERSTITIGEHATMQSLDDAEPQTGTKSYYNGTNLTLTATPASGYRFVQWSDGNTDNPRTLTVSESATYTAEFESDKTEYTISFNDYDGTELKSGKVEENTRPTCTEPSREQTVSTVYSFAGWKSSIDEQVYATAELPLATAPATYTATYSETPRQYTITIPAATNGTVVVKNGEIVVNSGDKVDYGTTLSLTATPAPGYKFVEWTDDAAANVTVNGDKTFGATFEAIPQYKVSIKEIEIGEGTIQVSDGTTPYISGERIFEEGTTLTLKLLPAEGYDYGEWVDEDDEFVSAEQTRTITLSGDMDLYADFMLKSFTLIESGDGANYDALPYGKQIRRMTLKRTFKAGTWSTLCLPMYYNVGPETSYDGLIYALYQGYTSDNRTIFNVEFNKTEWIAPGVPYMFLSKTEVVNPVFEYVTFEDVPAQTVTDGGTGDVEYIGVLQTPVELQPQDKNVRYVSSNKLYYPASKIAKITFDRAYFHMKSQEGSVAPRLRLFAEGESIEDADVSQDVEIKKYIENDILVVERNGIKYDAQGKLLQ